MLSLRLEPFAGHYAAPKRNSPPTVSLAEAARLAGLASEAEFRQAAYEVQSQARVADFSILCLIDGSHRAPLALVEAVRNRRRSAQSPTGRPTPPIPPSPTTSSAQSTPHSIPEATMTAHPSAGRTAADILQEAAIAFSPMSAAAGGQLPLPPQHAPPTHVPYAKPGNAAAQPVTAKPGQAKVVWDALVQQKAESVLKRRQLGKPKATLNAWDFAKIKEEVAAENPDLHHQLCAEATHARHKRLHGG